MRYIPSLFICLMLSGSITADEPLKPQFVIVPASIIEACEGDSLRLQCRAEGEAISFSWFKDNKVVSTGKSLLIQKLERTD